VVSCIDCLQDVLVTMQIVNLIAESRNPDVFAFHEMSSAAAVRKAPGKLTARYRLRPEFRVDAFQH